MDLQDLFNLNCINAEIYKQMQRQQFECNQEKEFAKMLNKFDEFIDAYNNIAPEYQKQAVYACWAKAIEKSNNKNSYN